MATNVLTVPVPPETVFAVLADAGQYAEWVVGARRVLTVDPAWPQAGTAFGHTLGCGPFTVHDETRVVDVDPPHLLVLDARAAGAGRALVRITLRPAGTGTRICLDERPAGGPPGLLPRAAVETAVWLRNALSLDRLARLAERRAAALPDESPDAASLNASP